MSNINTDAVEEILGHDLYSVRNGVVFLDDTNKPVSDQIMEDIIARSEVLALPMQTHDEAVAALLEWAGGVLAKIKGPVLTEEELLWPDKGPAAVAYLAGTANAEQVADIEDEAALTNEDPTALASVIADKAQVFRSIVRTTTGLRRSTIAALEAVDTPQERIDILEGAKAAAFRKLGEMGISLS